MADFCLTSQQQHVVDHRGGALLVSAAAGSGKTRVLVERLMSFLCDEEKPANIDSFLIITYTKAAAAELRTRIASELSARLSLQPDNRHLQRQLIRLHAAQISTVHAFCAQLLLEYAHEIGIAADFRVLEQTQANTLRHQALEQVLDQAYSHLQERPERAMVFDTLGAGRDDHTLETLLMELYEQVRCHPDSELWMRKSVENLRVQNCKDAAETIWGDYLIKHWHETLERACRELQAACREMEGYEALKRAYLPTYQQNLSDFQEREKLDSWDEIVKKGMPEKGRVKAVRKFEDEALLEQVKRRRSDAFDRVEKAFQPFTASSKMVLADLQSTANLLSELFLLLEEFMKCYDEEKRRLRAMDFSDLEHNALKLLRKDDATPTQTAGQIAGRYEQIMVDEYQDTNEVQDTIFRMISRDERNCFFVGDVKQSIYRFRLADPGIFLQKYHRFPLADGRAQLDGSKILLSQNFRSRPQILQAVNDVFRGVMSEQVGELNYTRQEELRPGREVLPIQEPVVELHCISTDRGDEDSPIKAEAEAAFAANRIAQMLKQGECIEEKNQLRPIRPEDVVILMRSPRSVVSVYLAALWSAGIPAAFELSGELLDTLEVQLMHCMLQVIDNPRQDIPLAAVLMSPMFGFSATELAEIRGESHEGCLFEALQMVQNNGKVVAFLQQLDQFRALRPALKLNDFLQFLIAQLQLEPLLCAMPDGLQRLENLHAFTQYLTATNQSLSRALNQITQLREQGGGIAVSKSGSSGVVRIMSIHSSKGLEFPVVLLCDLSHRFNLQDLRAQVLTHPQYGVASVAVDMARRVRYPTIAKTALAMIKEAETKSEELRILYVAMTRARERLIMSYCSASLDRTLRGFVMDATYPVAPERAMEASSAGDWVLQSAITRLDAEALHAQGCPSALRQPESQWKIVYHTAEVPEQNTLKAPASTRNLIWPSAQTLEDLLDETYPYQKSCFVPVKLTATQLKGRMLDEELEDAPMLLPEQKQIQFPVPDFSQLGNLTAAERGTALHLFMQFADYHRCATLNGIEAERERLLREEFLTRQQINALDNRRLLAFFQSELGMRVLACQNLVREFKFSVLVPASCYYPGAQQDEMLLQGVVDCCLDEPDGLIVLDFKTDYVRPGEEMQRGHYYQGQLQAYAQALEKIFNKPVLQRVVYFFATDTWVQV